MHHFFRAVLAFCILSGFVSCKEKKDAKEISEVLPGNIEMRLEQIKDLKFSIDSNGSAVKFSDLDLPLNTVVVFSPLNAGRVEYAGKPEVAKADTTDLFIPCCKFKDSYSRVPIRVSYQICFTQSNLEQLPPLTIKGENDRSVTTGIVVVKKNARIIKFRCFAGQIELEATVECLRCVSTETICSIKYELFGQQHIAPFQIPPAEYFTGSGQSNVPCGNCPDHAMCPTHAPVK